MNDGYCVYVHLIDWVHNNDDIYPANINIFIL